MTQEKAWLLTDGLTTIATDGRFIYYHHWRAGDVLIWMSARRSIAAPELARGAVRVRLARGGRG